MRLPAWLRALLGCVVAVGLAALFAGRFGAILVGGMALWGLGAYALPALVELFWRRRRRRAHFCARPQQRLR